MGQLRVSCFCIVVLVLLMGCTQSPSMSDVNKGERMSTENISVPASAYFDLSDEVENALLLDMSEQSFRGVEAHSPDEFDLVEHEAVPFIVVYQKSAIDEWNSRFDDSCFVVVDDLEFGEVHIAPCILPPEGKNMGLPSRESEAQEIPQDIDDDYVTGLKQIDVMSVVGLGNHSAKYAVSFIAYDQVSNARIVSLNNANKPQERKPGSESHKGASVEGDIKSKNSPELPELGIAANIPDRVFKADGHLDIALAYNLPALERKISPVRVRKLTVLIAGANENFPYMFDVVLGQDVVSPSDKFVSGYASVKVDVGALGLNKSEYALYLTMEGVVSGPFKFKYQ